jgi:hypothetical protein
MNHSDPFHPANASELANIPRKRVPRYCVGHYRIRLAPNERLTDTALVHIIRGFLPKRKPNMFHREIGLTVWEEYNVW